MRTRGRAGKIGIQGIEKTGKAFSPAKISRARAADPALSMARDAGQRSGVFPPGPLLGTSYTKNVAESAGMTDAQAFDLMAQMGVSIVRLGAYWDQIQGKGPGEFAFSKLDEQLALARQHGMKVVLTVGMKAPGWPEGYVPGWARPKNLQPDKPTGALNRLDAWLCKHNKTYNKLRGEPLQPTNLAQDPGLRDNALRYIQKLVEHVQGQSQISAFQVENEPGVPFGPHREYVGLDFVKEEIKTIKGADLLKRPLVMNVGVPLTPEDRAVFDLPDVAAVGLDIYPKIGGKALGKDRIVSLGEDVRMNKAPGAARKLAKQKGKEVYVAELQAEPWNPVPWTAQESLDHFHQQRRNGFQVIQPWNLGTVLRQYAKGDKSHFEAWKRMGEEAKDDIPPPPAPRRNPLNEGWTHLKEFWTGKDSGHL